MQIKYHGQAGNRSYTYGWTGREQLEVDDIVILPATSADPGDHWVLGYVVDPTSDYPGDVEYVLRAIRGRMLK